MVNAVELRQSLSPVRGGLARVSELLAGALGSDVSPLAEASAHLTLLSGKMIRPALCLLSAGAAGGDVSAESLLLLAAALELLHTATLIHDDIIDGSALRRGRPTVNARWGDRAALLAGDFVFAKAFRLVCAAGDGRLTADLASVVAGMCEGEAIQMQTSPAHRDEATYLDIIRRKTAGLMSACCRCGAVLVHGSAEDAAALSRFGLAFGLAYQITDDNLDLAGDSAALGKPVASDVASGAPSLALFHLAASPGAPPDPSALPSGQLLDLLRSAGSLDYATRAARRHADDAKAALELLSPSRYREALSALADFGCCRDR